MTVFERVFQMMDSPAAIIRSVKHYGFIMDVNESFIRLTGLEYEYLIDKPIGELLENWSLKHYKTSTKREGLLHTCKPGGTPVMVEHNTLSMLNEERQALSLIVLSDLSSHHWIEQQFETNTVLFSGILDANYQVQLLKDPFPAYLLVDGHLNGESFLEIVAESEHLRLLHILEETRKFKKTNHITVKTTKVNGVELEVKITFTPIFDGFGRIKEYAFIVLDLQPINTHEYIDSSMRLKIWMAKRDISAGQLAAATGISIQTISKLRNGKIKMPQRLTAELIASELKVDCLEIWQKIRK
ncbi:PAS domain-containing protein [Paenibacillus sp. FSL H8-0537]|uniref:PAS domain-containing protein n=1 Tax=Paenibacillus sp. FSL H8-0537 TaxID=2921399 RepID=UPI003100B270